MLKHGILGLLSYGDMTGYEITAVFRDSLSHFWEAQTSQIYRELAALEKKGWAKSTRVAQKFKPDKNVFSITASGRDELSRWVRDDAPKASVRNAMLMRTIFRGECGIDENIEYFKRLPDKEAVFADRPNPSVAAAGYAETVGDPLRALYWKFTIDFGVMYETMLREWCADCVRELEAFKHENPAD